MPAAGKSTRDIAVEALTAIRAHVKECTEFRKADAQIQADRHRDNQQAIGECYNKIADVAAGIGRVELSAQAAVAQVKAAATAEIATLRTGGAKKREDFLKWALGGTATAVLALAGLLIKIVLETKGVKLP